MLWSLPLFSVPPREGGFGSNVKWLTLCTRQGSVSPWGAFQAWASQRQKADFKNPQKSNTQRVGTETPFVSLTHYGSVPFVLYQGAPQCISLRPQFRSATAASTLLNQEIERFLLFLLIQVPPTGLRFFSYRNWIFPKLHIFRPWLLVSPTSSTAKEFQKIKYCHLSPVDIYQRADFQHEDPQLFSTALSLVLARCSCKGLHWLIPLSVMGETHKYTSLPTASGKNFYLAQQKSFACWT